MSILGRPGRRRRNVDDAPPKPQDFCGFYRVECHRVVPPYQPVTLAPYVGQFLEGVSMAEARRENTPLGTLPVLPPIPDWARAPAIPPNPDAKKLRWDADKRAFRFIHPPTRCSCGGAKSMLTGEKLTCGLCDGRASSPARFRPGPVYDPCRYWACLRAMQGDQGQIGSSRHHRRRSASRRNPASAQRGRAAGATA